MRGPARAALLALLLPLLGGCRAGMAELRFGPQLGADLQLSGLLHAGLFGGATVSLAGGSYQGDEGSFATGEASLALFHLRERASLPGQQHSCLGLLPPLLCGLVSDERNAHPWAFELGLGLVLVGVRIGFDPAVALGGAEPEWGPEDEERRADPGSSR